jgi:hypothetical protein
MRGGSGQGGGDRGFSIEQHIATIQKNGLDSIEVAFKEYKSAVYLDIRTYSQFDGQDEKQPTKRGITLKSEQIHELREALEKAEAHAQRSAGPSTAR